MCRARGPPGQDWEALIYSIKWTKIVTVDKVKKWPRALSFLTRNFQRTSSHVWPTSINDHLCHSAITLGGLRQALSYNQGLNWDFEEGEMPKFGYVRYNCIKYLQQLAILKASCVSGTLIFLTKQKIKKTKSKTKPSTKLNKTKWKLN